MKRRAPYITAATLILLALALLLRSQENEPRYKGKRLSAWLPLYRTRLGGPSEGPSSDEPELAIRTIGTNAVPYLLEWLPYKETAGHKWIVAVLQRLPPSVRYNKLTARLGSDSKRDRAVCAMCGFRALREIAAPAIPDLMVLARSNDTNTFSGLMAIYALSGIGDTAIPIIANALTSLPPFRRVAVAASLGDDRFFSGDPKLRVPVLLTCLEDQDPFVATAAATSLGRLAVEPDLVLPALKAAADKNVNVRIDAINAIGRFGDRARSATPFLTSYLGSTPPDEANAAASALRRVTPEILTNAPAK